MEKLFVALVLAAAGCWAAPGHAQGSFAPLPIQVTGPRSRMVSTANFTFTDPKGKKWLAPSGTITDGLFISSLLLPLVLPLIDDVWAPRAVPRSVYGS